MTLQDVLGHRFDDPELLHLALTHRSISAERSDRPDNERLEFLGDAVLQLVMTHVLFDEYPRLSEGQLAKVRASLVSRQTLAEIARSLKLGEHIDMAPGEERTGGREKASILADSLEAVIGAVYLDAGLDSARELILSHWSHRVAEKAKRPGVMDYKTRLQELLARQGRRPEYEVAGAGPDHDRRFTARVTVGGALLGEGEGRSKKAAEQEAASAALRSMIEGGA